MGKVDGDGEGVVVFLQMEGSKPSESCLANVERRALLQ
jgi:hypothetical protein